MILSWVIHTQIQTPLSSGPFLPLRPASTRHSFSHSSCHAGDQQIFAPSARPSGPGLRIMGPYWKETLSQSCFAPWKHKITSLDMAVDGAEYPHLKKHFNPPGRRGYLYIGSSSDRPEKGCDILEKTMAKLSGFPNGWIGGGRELSGMKRIATYASLTPSFMVSLANQFDFFINTSISDANPTTILEAMAWGFPVACTPGSGYHNIQAITTLSSTDIEYNAKILRDLQFAPEDHLQWLSQEGRRLIETHYSWERFCSTVWNGLQPYTC